MTIERTYNIFYYIINLIVLFRLGSSRFLKRKKTTIILELLEKTYVYFYIKSLLLKNI
jgi:hypothetical protein